MRKLILVFIPILSCSILLKCHSVPVNESIVLDHVDKIATYSLKFQQDSTNPEFIKEEVMLLLLGENISLFISQNKYTADNELGLLTTDDQSQEWIFNNGYSLMTRFHYRIYKNYPKEKLTHIEKIMPIWFKYEENLDLFNWYISSDTATIAGYKSRKAISDFAGRSWIAWFSPEFPINDGPYKFNGLPGLIVKVYDNRMHYIFELATIERPEQDLIIDLENRQYVETNKIEFFQKEDEFRNNIRKRSKDAGHSKEMQEKAVKNMALRNNSIELKR